MAERESAQSDLSAGSKPDDYNGWKNYPTWDIHLWLANNEVTYHQAMMLLAVGGTLSAGADNLRAFVQDNNPLKDESSPYADILGWALQIVDWDEVAAALAPDAGEALDDTDRPSVISSSLPSSGN